MTPIQSILLLQEEAVAEYKKGVIKMFTNLEKKFSQCNDGKGFFVGTTVRLL